MNLIYLCIISRILLALSPGSELYNLVAWYSWHAQNEALQVRSMICSEEVKNDLSACHFHQGIFGDAGIKLSTKSWYTM